jgi:hypothetical protein
MAKHQRHPTEHDAPSPDQGETHETEATSTQSLVINGLTFTINSPYLPGHVITPGEARALNQTRAENLRNNFSKTVQAAKGEGATVSDEVKAELDAKLAAYEAEYSFEKVRVAGTRTTHVDPVEKETFRLATQFVEAALNAKKLKRSDIKPDNFKELVAQVIAKKPEIREQARLHVEALSALGHSAIDALGDSEIQLVDKTPPEAIAEPTVEPADGADWAA